jgi:hypothetical protein
MSGDSSRRMDKRSIPYEDIEGEEAYMLSGKLLPRNQHPRGAEVQAISQEAEDH